MTEYPEYKDKEYIDKLYFKNLAEKDPEEVIRHTLCQYDKQKKAYEVSLFDSKIRIYPYEMRIEKDATQKQTFHPFLDLFIVHYLLSAKDIKIQNEWISEKDVPGGSTFFRGPHAIPCHLISERFGNDIHRFVEQCSKLNGKPLSLADSSFAIDVTYGIPVAVLLWIGDEEFPAESRLLFDKSIINHFAPDIIFALAVGFCERIVADNYEAVLYPRYKN
jgi:hypothetical protein